MNNAGVAEPGNAYAWRAARKRMPARAYGFKATVSERPKVVDIPSPAF